MRVWPCKIKFELIRLAETDPKSPDSGGEFIREQKEVTIEALCADAALRKVKDHYLKLYPGAAFKFGPVDWYSADLIGKVILSF